MENFTETVCRLCLHVINDGNFKILEETWGEVLRILLNVNVKEQIKPICTACSKRLFEAYHFKITCLDMEDNISSQVNSENTTPVDLKGIYLKMNGNEHLGATMEDKQICRLCMNIVTSGFTSVENVETDVIQTCIPEINFNFTKEPVICAICLNSLITHSSFLKNCIVVEEQNKYFPINKEMCFKAEEIEIKSEKSDDDSDIAFHSNDELAESIDKYNHTSQSSRRMDNNKQFLYDRTINSEEKQIYAYDYIKHENNSKLDQFEQNNPLEELTHKYNTHDFKHDQSSDLSHRQQRHDNISEPQLFECDVCNFKAERKDYLMKHQLTHKSTSNIGRYECNTCDCKADHKDGLLHHQLKHKCPSKVQMYTCDTCDFQTEYKSQLLQHWFTHKESLEIEMYKCDRCDYKTKRRNHLIRHQLKHKSVTQMRLYECDTCNFKANRKDNLRKHELKHKNSTEVQMYTCDRCDFKTRWKENLVRHQRRHEEVSNIRNCESHVHDYKASHKDHQLKHKSPSEVQMYSCSSCVYKTERIDCLVEHQQTHKDISDIRKYECDISDHKVKDRLVKSMKLNLSAIFQTSVDT